MNMDILAALPGFALAFILIFCYEYRIKLIKTKQKKAMKLIKSKAELVLQQEVKC